MKLDRKNITKILFILFSAIIFAAIVKNYQAVFGLVTKIFIAIRPFIVGACIAFILNQPLRFFERKVFTDKRLEKRKFLRKIKRPVSILYSIVFVGLLLTIFLMIIIPEIRKSVINLAELLPYYMDTVSDTIDYWLSEFGLSLNNLENIDWNMVSEKIVGYIKDGSIGDIVGKTLGITSSMFSIVFTTALGFVFSIYILASKEKLGRQIKSVVYYYFNKSSSDNFFRILKLANDTFSKFIVCQCTEALILGTLCYIGMQIFNMPFALMISSLITLMALIPIFGALIGTSIGAFMILLISPIKAVWFVIFIILLQWFEGNIIYPRVVGKSVGLPALWVLFSVMVGSSLFGVLGLLVSVPTCSVLYCLMREKIRNN